jgi:hypothetical protein
MAPLAITVSVVTLSFITEPAIAGDSTRSMPANREGGGSRDACQARRLVHLVPITDRFVPGEPRRIAVLEGSAPRPAPLQVRLGSLGVWTLPAETVGMQAEIGPCDGVAAGHAVGNPRLFERGCRPQRPFTDGLHGLDHPLPGEIVELDGHATPMRCRPA